MIRRHFLISSFFALAACAGPIGPITLAPNATLIVVRHVDREGEDLSAAGHARAQALVTALDGMAIDAIYSPGIKRNLDTAAPLAATRGLPTTRLAQEAPTRGLTRHGAGETVIWVGNKGNIRTIWDDLGLADPAPLEYGDLHIIRADAAGTLTIERRHFGAR